MRRAILAAAATLAVTGCSTRQAENTQAPTGDATGVTREEAPAPTPEPLAAPVVQALQTQPGPDGTAVALNRVAVTGDVLTVALTYTGGSCCLYVEPDKVAYIDDATSQRVGVLKDNAGAWMAGPLESDGERLRIGYNGKTTQVFFKFPAPPATSKTISLTIPEVAPFTPVAVTR